MKALTAGFSEERLGPYYGGKSMLFRVFARNELETLYEILAVNHVVGPVSRGKSKKGRELFAFDYLYDFQDLRLDFTTTTHSLKPFVLPFQETLSSFKVEDDSWEKYVDLNIYKQHVFFGVHACDINALNKLDKVLSEQIYPDPFYTAKRRNMFIIGIDCHPQPFCFCRSMGTDTVLHGFDMLLTDLGDRYFVEIQSARAWDILQQIPTEEPDEEDHRRFVETVEARNQAFSCQVDTSDLTKILDLEFQSPVWEEWGRRCLSCGTCANVCPTCYCYGVREHVDPDLQGASKIRQLYSCNLIDFAEVAGNHNFRPDSSSRLKYRYYHKHRGFQEVYEEPLCVGCGRCGQACLAGITVPEVIASVRGQEEEDE